ncbi:MAG: AAA family ATPase [Thermomicrobiales bacterium]
MGRLTEPGTVPVLIVTGPVGVGKTTVAGAISERLEEVRLPHTIVDMDALRSSFPRPDGDPFHEELGLANLADVWRNSRATGSRRLVLADVVETPDLSGYCRAIPGADIVVVRLVADAETNAARLRRRDSGSGLEWHLARAVELAELLERNGIGNLVVDASEASPAELAAEILARAGWLAAD